VSYEIQPPSYTSLKILEGPPRGGGGDTLFSSQYAVYDLLSPGYQKYLEGLTALHSAHEQAQGSRDAGRPVRREPIVSEHPLVRVNPVTGFKSVYYNPGFVVAIKGVPKLEGEAIKAYLDQVIMGTAEIQARVQWAPGTIVFWDNRSVV
jgi:sulfonate dioxygenase